MPNLFLEGAVKLEQSVTSAVSQAVIAAGSSKHDEKQKFATLVLKGGRTSLPSLHMPDLATPLTHSAFAAGLFDPTATGNLGSSFGQTNIRMEIRSASKEQYNGDFNPEKEWHQHTPTPWDVMHLSPAQALTLSCQACGVQVSESELRETYGQSFVIKGLEKLHHECSMLFPQDCKMIGVPNLASIFEEPGFVTPDCPQHQFGTNRTYCSARTWSEQLEACGIEPANVSSQVFKPWESAAHAAPSSYRERSRGTGKGKKGGKREGQSHRSQEAVPGQGKGRHW